MNAPAVVDVEHRYLHDAEFHARVSRAVAAVIAMPPPGVVLTRADVALVTYGAMFGVEFAERDAATGERHEAST